jgi:hypothetical protein
MMGHPVLFGSNFAMRPGVWLMMRDKVSRWDPTLHDDFELSILLPHGTAVVWDETLRMPVSARPFASFGAIGSRLWKAMLTFKATWPAWTPWVKRTGPWALVRGQPHPPWRRRR